MTRTQTIGSIKAKLDDLSDEQLAALADITEAFTAEAVYDTLADIDKAAIDAALDRLDRGEGVPVQDVKARLDARLKAAGV